MSCRLLSHPDRRRWARYLGSHPRAKVSMTIMRLLQLGCDPMGRNRRVMLSEVQRQRTSRKQPKTVANEPGADISETLWL